MLGAKVLLPEKPQLNFLSIASEKESSPSLRHLPDLFMALKVSVVTFCIHLRLVR